MIVKTHLYWHFTV